VKASEHTINHLIPGFSVGTIASYLILSLPYISSESACILIIFNFLFISLTFPLDGTLARKLFMLLTGNFIGLVWNYLLSLFAYAAAYNFGRFFNTLYIILSPFVNLIWIVSFWSISLTVLANSKKKAGLKLDN